MNAKVKQQTSIQYQQMPQSEMNCSLANGLIRLYDDLGRLLDNYQSKGTIPLTHEHCLKLIKGIQEDAEMLLFQHDIRAVTNADDRYNPHTQSAIKHIPTSDKSKVGKIAERVRPGFEQDNKLLKKEQVNIYVEAPSTKLRPKADIITVLTQSKTQGSETTDK